MVWRVHKYIKEDVLVYGLNDHCLERRVCYSMQSTTTSCAAISEFN